MVAEIRIIMFINTKENFFINLVDDEDKIMLE